jgi:hypothetical protein
MNAQTSMTVLLSGCATCCGRRGVTSQPGAHGLAFDAWPGRDFFPGRSTFALLVRSLNTPSDYVGDAKLFCFRPLDVRVNLISFDWPLLLLMPGSFARSFYKFVRQDDPFRFHFAASDLYPVAFEGR